MEILYLSHKNPVREDEGAKIVIMGTLRHLSAKGCSITLVYLDQDGTPPGELLDICEKVRAVPHAPFGGAGKAGKAAGLAASLLTGLPYTVRMFSNPLFEKAIREEASAKAFDVVHMETSLLYQYAGALRGLPVVVRHHNLEGNLLKQQARAAEGRLEKNVFAWQAEKLSEYEARAISMAERSIAITEADRESMVRDYSARRPVDVIPSGIDARECSHDGEPEHCLVFSGRVEWGPNAEGVTWFATEVFPLIANKFPKLKLYIVGGRPGRRLMELSRGNVVVTGFVNDIKSYIRRCEVYVVPLISGSGMRLKILEAMASGRAVVSTAKGAEGITFRNGHDIMIADGARDFASAVVDLLEDGAKRRALGANALANVRKNYSWDKVADMFIESYRKAISGVYDVTAGLEAAGL